MEPTPNQTYTLAELMQCAAREVGMRETCYVKWDKKTSVNELSPSRKREIGMMRAIEQLLALQATPPAPLADGELAALERLDAEATPAPWNLYDPGTASIDACFQGPMLFAGALRQYRDVPLLETSKKQNGLANATLLKTLRNALPGLLARLAAAEAKWIAVGDRLPVDEIDNHDNPFGTTLVLVARPAAPYVSAVALGYRYDGNWFIVREGTEDDFIDNSVTHWQPAPAPTVKGGQPHA